MMTRKRIMVQRWSCLSGRYDLVDNLVSTVKGYAEFEKKHWLEAIPRRELMLPVSNITADEITPANIEKFEQAQAGAGVVLSSRLMMTIERYPGSWKASAHFQWFYRLNWLLEQKINIVKKRL